MNKKKLITTLGALSLAAVLSVGGTVAYLTDKETVTNRFTVGSVEIDLTEENWAEEEHQDLQPGETVKKDPKITNQGVNDAYVYLEVVVPKANIITAAEDGTRLNGGSSTSQELFTFTPNENWTLLKRHDNSSAVIYLFSYDKILANGESTNTLFDTMTFANVIEGQIEGENYNVYVHAFAIQTANTGDGSGDIPSEARAAYDKYLKQNYLPLPE